VTLFLKVYCFCVCVLGDKNIKAIPKVRTIIFYPFIYCGCVSRLAMSRLFHISYISIKCVAHVAYRQMLSTITTTYMCAHSMCLTMAATLSSSYQSSPQWPPHDSTSCFRNKCLKRRIISHCSIVVDSLRHQKTLH